MPSDYVKGLQYANELIAKAINEQVNHEWWQHEDTQFEAALMALEDVGIKAAKEHTGGGVYVIYVREPFEQDQDTHLTVPDFDGGTTIAIPHIGITPTEEDNSKTFLVMGYRTFDDDSTTWMETSSLVGLPEVVEEMTQDMRRTIAYEVEMSFGLPSRKWVHEQLVAGEMTEAGGEALKRGGADHGWLAYCVVSGYLDYDTGEPYINGRLRPRIIHLHATSDDSHAWAVYWVDEIGLNDWIEWFDTYAEALIYLARLEYAVFTDKHVDEVWVDIHNEAPRS